MIRWLLLVQRMSCPPHSFVGVARIDASRRIWAMSVVAGPQSLENHHESANSLTADDAVKAAKQLTSSTVLQQLDTHFQRDSLSADAA